jgi:hypothetical protein
VQAVQRPENGFVQLKKVLTRDLSDRNVVLPIRLRVALAGLDAIRERLTPSAYDKLGGSVGLEASYVKCQVSRCGGDPDEVHSLLMTFVTGRTPGAQARRDLARGDLIRCLSGDADKVLAKLEQSRILVKRIVPGQGERWSLYHDYLSFGLSELDKRLRYWAIFLDNADTRFQSANIWSKWPKLLSPKQQFALWLSRAAGRLRFEGHGRYVLLSFVRLAVNWFTLTMAIAIGFYYLITIERVRGAVARFDKGSVFSVATASFQESWMLATAGWRLRDAVEKELFSSDEQREKYWAHAAEFNRALSGLSMSRREHLAAVAASFLDDDPFTHFYQLSTMRTVLDAARAHHLIGSLDLDISNTIDPDDDVGGALLAVSGSLDNSEATKEFAKNLLTHIHEESLNLDRRADVGEGLAALSPNLTDFAPVLESAEQLEALIHTKSGGIPYITNSLASAVRDLSASIRSPVSANRLAERLEKDVSNQTIALEARRDLAAGLAAISAQVRDSVVGRDLSQRLATAFYDRQTDESIRYSLAEAIGKLSANLQDLATPAEDIARTLEVAIGDGKGGDALGAAKALAGMSTFQKNWAPAHVVAQRLAAKIRDDTERNDYSNHARIAQVLAPLTPYLRDSKLASDLAGRLANDMEQNPDSRELPELAYGLAALTGTIEETSTFREMADLALSSVRDDRQADCGALAQASRPSDMHTIVELLQWPQCASIEATSAILKVAELRAFGADTNAKPDQRFGNLNSFVKWAEEQNKRGRADLDLNRVPPNPFGTKWLNWLN